MRQVSGGKRDAWPTSAQFRHQLRQAPTHRVTILGLVQVNHGWQRSQQRPRLANVHLEAGAREREFSPAIVQDHLTWPGMGEQVPRADWASLGLVASVKEWPLGTMMQSPAVSRNGASVPSTSSQQAPAVTAWHLISARLVAEPDGRPAAHIDPGR